MRHQSQFRVCAALSASRCATLSRAFCASVSDCVCDRWASSCFPSLPFPCCEAFARSCECGRQSEVSFTCCLEILKAKPSKPSDLTSQDHILWASERWDDYAPQLLSRRPPSRSLIDPVPAGSCPVSGLVLAVRLSWVVQRLAGCPTAVAHWLALLRACVLRL